MLNHARLNWYGASAFLRVLAQKVRSVEYELVRLRSFAKAGPHSFMLLGTTSKGEKRNLDF